MGDNVRGVDVGWVEVRIFGRVKQALGLFDSPRPFGNFYRVRREIRCKYEILGRKEAKPFGRKRYSPMKPFEVASEWSNCRRKLRSLKKENTLLTRGSKLSPREGFVKYGRIQKCTWNRSSSRLASPDDNSQNRRFHLPQRGHPDYGQIDGQRTSIS